MKDFEMQKPRSKPLGELNADGFFESGLEYNTPARGMWNIVHTGMLIPGAHQIFACAEGCLRGVILTAAEMLALDRLSWISVSEQDMFDGTLESDIVDGVCEIIGKLPKKPTVILLYLSCIHLFAGVDFEAIIDELSEKFPDIAFADCYMTPTMRTNVTPVAKMAQQLYAPLKELPLDERAVGIVGCDRATDPDSELVRIIRENGFALHDLTLCETYDEYLKCAESSLNISYLPYAELAGESLKERFGAEHLHLPNAFYYPLIKENYTRLCAALDLPVPDFSEDIAAADRALDKARETVGDTAVAIDFTAVTRPFELAELLVGHGFNVKYIIADTAAAEAEAFERLKALRPDILVYAAANVNMLNICREEHEPVLAIGQKAAYYFATDNFVNIIMNGGLYGLAGVAKLAAMTEDAYLNKKDRKAVISLKGFGCASCLSG